MSTLSVCPNCRDTCPKCHSKANPTNSHPIWVCSGCKKDIGTKCCVCEGPKSGSGNVGAGKVCKDCYKMNRCTFCGTKI